MTSRLFPFLPLRLVGLLVVLFGTFGRPLPAVAGRLEGAVVRVAEPKLACSTPALSNHLEALPADALVWSLGPGLPAGPASAGLLPAFPSVLFGSAGASHPLPYVQPVAYPSLVQARLLRAALCPNAP